MQFATSKRSIHRRCYNILQNEHKEGQQLRFGDFAVKYVIGNGKNFDFGVDYVRCSIYQFMQDQGAEEFAPYICMSGIALSDALGWELIRTETLADSCSRADMEGWRLSSI